MNAASEDKTDSRVPIASDKLSGHKEAAFDYPSPWIAWSGVGLLFLVYASSFVDRQIMSLVVMPIRQDLAISDTQFSLLSGFAFASFYAIFGIPIGILVDRSDRRFVLSAGIALWSTMTMLCGYAASFSGLFLARLGVGVGEGTVAPGTYSLLADYFPSDKRGIPMGIFGAGVYAGIGLAFVIGGAVIGSLKGYGVITLGVLGHFSPWQAAFLIVGAPGLVLALLVLLLFEPRRKFRVDEPSRQVQRSDRLIAYWRGGFKGIASHHLTTSLLAMALYAIVAWSPEFLRRSFDMTVKEVGILIGTTICVFGTCGVIGGGAASDWLVRRGVPAARMRILSAAGVSATPCLYEFSMAQQPVSAIAWLAASVLILSVLTACGPLGVQEIYPPRLRGRGAACFQLLVTLIGLGLGPTVVAMTSDFAPWANHSLGGALSLTTPAIALAAGMIAIFGSKSYSAALVRAQVHTSLR